jgi:hypothetical protein
MFWCKLCSFTLKQLAEVLSQGLLGYVSFLNNYNVFSFHYHPGQSQNNFTKVSIHLQHTRNVTFGEWRVMIHMIMIDWHEKKHNRNKLCNLISFGTQSSWTGPVVTSFLMKISVGSNSEKRRSETLSVFQNCVLPSRYCMIWNIIFACTD